MRQLVITAAIAFAFAGPALAVGIGGTGGAPARSRDANGQVVTCPPSAKPCTNGVPHGNTCIPKNKVCHEPHPPTPWYSIGGGSAGHAAHGHSQ